MLIYTDQLTESDLYRELPSKDLFLICESKGTKKAARKFSATVYALPELEEAGGHDSHGIPRQYHTNSGYAGGTQVWAATWVEIGDWMVHLFRLDPFAKIGYYDGWEDFVFSTETASAHRPEHENAPVHAERWARELNSLRDLV